VNDQENGPRNRRDRRTSNESPRDSTEPPTPTTPTTGRPTPQFDEADEQPPIRYGEGPPDGPLGEEPEPVEELVEDDLPGWPEDGEPS